jgi:hypothetical protein
MLDTKFATGSVTATGVICQMGVEDMQVPVGVGVGNVFVGTVLVEVTYDAPSGTPNWIQFGSSLTAPGTVKVDVPVRAIRVRCSAFTSGTITAGIGGNLGSV